MLNARTETADDEGGGQHRKTGAGAGEEIADAGERGTGRQQRRAADTLGELTSGDLKPGHRPGIEGAQNADLGIAKAKLRLPQRQQHIEQIGKAVVQRVGAAGHRHRPPLPAAIDAADQCRNQRQSTLLCRRSARIVACGAGEHNCFRIMTDGRGRNGCRASAAAVSYGVLWVVALRRGGGPSLRTAKAPAIVSTR